MNLIQKAEFPWRYVEIEMKDILFFIVILKITRQSKWSLMA